MDLSRSLAILTRWLIQESQSPIGIQKVAVFIEPLKFKQVQVIIQTELKELIQKNISSSAVSSSTFGAYLRALCELAENLSLEQSFNAKTRNGFAAGIFKKSTIDRAYYELIERDSFLYHYQNCIPFINRLHQLEKDDFSVFQMHSKSLNCSSIIVMEKAAIGGHSPCLIFGLGTHQSPKKAFKKALQEYLTLKKIHVDFPEWCQDIQKPPEDHSADNLIHFHHFSSRDPRNKERFKQISQVKNSMYHEIQNHLNLKTTKLPSPVFGIKVFRIQSNNLKEMNFGVPEKNLVPSLMPHYCENPLALMNESPLYHPFW